MIKECWPKFRSLQQTSNHHHSWAFTVSPTPAMSPHPHILPYTTCDSLSPVQPSKACRLSDLSSVLSEIILLEKTVCKPLIHSCTISSISFFPLNESCLLDRFWWITFLSTLSAGALPTHSKPPWTLCVRLIVPLTLQYHAHKSNVPPTLDKIPSFETQVSPITETLPLITKEPVNNLDPHSWNSSLLTNFAMISVAFDNVNTCPDYQLLTPFTFVIYR